MHRMRRLQLLWLQLPAARFQLMTLGAGGDQYRRFRVRLGTGRELR
jgi:hypothetical protein